MWIIYFLELISFKVEKQHLFQSKMEDKPNLKHGLVDLGYI